ncbi:DUF6371 domain-containing protein [Hymenobacter radiodurans]|uniref:DUF6371 domain-containing protein n=1 Tax=Hymenobacter radiodurans TaxID=2496028 RepID=UPI00196B8A29|nr:DUF6371 domain-containing protein [Hymenobacter radiodurans]
MAPTSEYRYALERYQGRRTRYTCPGCGSRHSFTRFTDGRTSKHLPEAFGICNRTDKCGYKLSPYDKGASGQSYADQIRSQERGGESFNSLVVSYKPPPRSIVDQPIYDLPQELRHQTLGQYDRNQFARLLQSHFGGGEADELLAQFQVGTSSYWPGATVFWFVDEQGRTRGGQVVLFEADGHTAKRPGWDGSIERCTRWVHTALLERYQQQGKPRPEWLLQYAQKGQKAPCLFGLPQLRNVPSTKPIMLVEAPKTAILCSHYFPGFVCLAVGAKSWLNAERLAPIKERSITAFPDGGACEEWSKKATELQAQGFCIQVSDFLESHATVEQLQAGYDLADVILSGWVGYPPSWNATF